MLRWQWQSDGQAYRVRCNGGGGDGAEAVSMRVSKSTCCIWRYFTNVHKLTSGMVHGRLKIIIAQDVLCVSPLDLKLMLPIISVNSDWPHQLKEIKVEDKPSWPWKVQKISMARWNFLPILEGMTLCSSPVWSITISVCTAILVATLAQTHIASLARLFRSVSELVVSNFRVKGVFGSMLKNFVLSGSSKYFTRCRSALLLPLYICRCLPNFPSGPSGHPVVWSVMTHLSITSISERGYQRHDGRNPTPSCASVKKNAPSRGVSTVSGRLLY